MGAFFFSVTAAVGKLSGALVLAIAIVWPFASDVTSSLRPGTLRVGQATRVNNRTTKDRKRALRLGLTGFLLLTPTELQAFELDWSAPAVCSDEVAVRAALESTTGARVESQLHFEGTITQPTATRFRLVLHAHETPVADAGSERIVEAATCDELTTAAVVVMALALASENGVDVDARKVSPTAEQTHLRTDARDVSGPQTLEASPSPVAANSAKASTPFSAAPEVGFIVDVGSLPRVAPGFALGSTLSLGRFSARLTGVAFPEQQAELSSGSGGRFSLWGAAGALCARSIPDPWYVTACAQMEVGQMRGQGTGVSNGRDGSALWLAPGADLTLHLPLRSSGFFGWARGGALFPLTRDQFELSGIGVVHQAASAGFRLGIGGGVSL